MSVDSLLKILVRAIEARDGHDMASRASVYTIARATLERFLEQNSDLGDAEKALQRRELELAILDIERKFSAVSERTAGSEAGSRQGVELQDEERPRPSEPVVRPPAADPAAPSAARETAPTSPPPPPRAAPLELEAAPSVAPPAISTADPAEDRREAATTPDRGRAVEDGDDDASIFAIGDDPPGRGPEAVEAEGEARRSHNLRGAVALILILVALGVAYGTNAGETFRRLFVGERSQEAGLPMVRPPQAETTVAAGKAIGSHPRFSRPSEKNVTPAHLRVDAATSDVGDFPGRMTWTRIGADANGVIGWSGHAAITGHPFVVDLAMEPNADIVADLTRMILIGWSGLSEPISEAPTFRRIDPRSGRSEEMRGVMVRVGLDRVLFGYRPEAADLHPEFERRSQIEVGFTLESGRRLLFTFCLPDPA